MHHTVKGLPLGPGERVVYYHHDPGGKQKVIYIVGGLLLLPILIGFYLLYKAFTADDSSTAIITTHRFIWLRGNDPSKTRMIAHGTIARAALDQDRRGLGVTGVTLVDRQNQLIVFATSYDQGRASFIMNAAHNPAQLASMPTVPHDA